MRGIILAGGHGTRLFPLTKSTSKQLLPVYDKPMIYYPLSTLMLAGIREIAIVCKLEHIEDFEALLGQGSQFGVSITYIAQVNPVGLPDAFNVTRDWIEGHRVCLILGDNIFYGPGLGRQLASLRFESGALIFAYQVKDPERFGVIEIGSAGDVVSLEEKPSNPKSNFAIPGLYFFDSRVAEKTAQLKPSLRGETEMVDLLRNYLREGSVTAHILPRGTAWLDTGTFESLHDAASFIKIMQDRTGLAVGDPNEIAKVQGWV